MARKQGSGLTSEQAQYLADTLKRDFLPRFDGNASEMARAWKISQPQLSQILGARGRGAGVAVLCRLRLATGRTIDELLGLDKMAPLGVSVDDRIRASLERILDERERAQSTAPRPIKSTATKPPRKLS